MDIVRQNFTQCLACNDWDLRGLTPQLHFKVKTSIHVHIIVEATTELQVYTCEGMNFGRHI